MRPEFDPASAHCKSERMDLLTLLALVAAVLIFFKLLSVLGRKTGNERPYDPMIQREAKKAPTSAATNDNVIHLPRSEDGMHAGAEPAVAMSAEDRLQGFLPDGSPASAGLLEIAKSDSSFDPKHFIHGARAAYEMVITAFAEGNRKVLKQLLNRDVFDGFASVITERETRGEKPDMKFIGIDKADVIDAEYKNRTSRITVKFVSQLITAIRNRSGEVIEGDPKKIREVTDIWTFARELNSRDPNWKLVATQSAN